MINPSDMAWDLHKTVSLFPPLYHIVAFWSVTPIAWPTSADLTDSTLNVEQHYFFKNYAETMHK